MQRLATIGVYDFDLDGFLATLRAAGVDLVLDVRQRRGVRGARYAWANSLRLQASLAAAGIGYRHLPELAPTTELRRLQYREDDRLGVGKRNRERLASEYAWRYVAEVLDKVDLAGLLSSLPPSRVAAFLCVERDAPACHRSLIAARAAELLELPVTDLRP